MNVEWRNAMEHLFQLADLCFELGLRDISHDLLLDGYDCGTNSDDPEMPYDPWIVMRSWYRLPKAQEFNA